MLFTLLSISTDAVSPLQRVKSVIQLALQGVALLAKTTQAAIDCWSIRQPVSLIALFSKSRVGEPRNAAT